jgi:WD40 repeat protein
MGLSVFRIRIQDKQSEISWKVRLELYQDETLREKKGIFQFQREDFSKLQNLSVKDYGIYLGKALFKNELREFFVSAFHNSEQSMKVALSIELDDSPESQQLKTLHWERLCAPIEDAWEYLALNQRLPFTHHVSTGNLRKYSLIQKENLRALILIANPEDLEAEYNLAPIDVEATVERIQDAFGEIKCDILANHTKNVIGLPTIKQLREKLSTANPPYTILHIVSHGRVKEGETTVYWSNEANQVEPIQAKYLIEQLRQCENLPHLIFLCCCSSASFFGGLAQSLIRDLATPIVIAMTDTVTIKTAVELSRNFYPRLQESGEVDVVLQRASIPLADRYDITVPALFSYRINSSLYGIQVNIVGGKDYALQIFAAAPNSVNGRINWAEYRTESQITEPYKFLSYYNTIDADIFFGRDAVSELLVAKIYGNKLVLINGKSGSGKTSLINAGIIPRLVEQGYFTMVFRDYGYPTETIKAALAKLENVNIDLSDCKTLLDCIQATIQQTGRSIVIFLDQFERFFINLSEDQWKQFARELKDCLNQLDSQQMNIVIALRDDFYGKLGEFWEDIPEINTESYQHYLKPLNPTEAKDAIEKPLTLMQEKVGYDSDFLETCLVPNLLQRSEGQSQDQIEPVHLQIVCNQLFEEVRKRYSEPLKAGKIVTIKQDLYDDLGGVEGILQGYVEVILHRQFNTREQQDEVKTVLKQMVNSRGTREFKSVAEIAENLSFEKSQVEKIIEQLDQSRLIETVSGEDSRKKYSITHEYLAKQINQWYTFNELELKRATELYERCLENWKLNNSNRIPRSQLEYLRKYRPNLLKWKPEGKQLFQESEWLYHGLNAAVVFSLATLVGLTITALIGQRNAVINQIEISRQASKIAFSSHQDLEGLIEALKAAKTLNHSIFKILPPQVQVQNQVQETLYQVVDGIKERNRFKGHQGKILSVNFNSDGTQLATAGEDGYVVLWNLKGEQLAKFEAHSSSINSVRFSPNNQYIVTEASNVARLWDLKGNQLGEEFKIGNNQIYPGSNISFNSDGEKILALGTDGVAHLRNSRGELLKKLQVQNSDIINVTFSPDGSKIATAANNGTVQLWDNEGNFTNQFQAHKSNDTQQVHRDYINTIAFSPNSQQIATAGGKFTTRLWDLEGNKLAEFKGPPPSNMEGGWIDKIIFSPDGKQIATYEVRGRGSVGFRLWDLEYLENDMGEFSGSKLIFLRDGKSFLIDGRLLPYSELENRFISPQNQVQDFALSPDGKLLVTTEFDTVRLWYLEGNLLAESKDIDSPLRFDTEKDVSQIYNLDQLMEQGCNWLHDYLKYSKESDRDLCEGVPPPQ